ncbi:MAG: stage II sporulation protein P [Eubacteriales bacterium]|nr:stage II sporulation protein P [Eubacteriales bacterium]
MDYGYPEKEGGAGTEEAESGSGQTENGAETAGAESGSDQAKSGAESAGTETAGTQSDPTAALDGASKGSDKAEIETDETAGAQADSAAPLDETSKDSEKTGAETDKAARTENGGSASETEETDSAAADGSTESAAIAASLPLAQLHDFNYLLNNYFILDVSTTIDETQLNYDTLTGKDLTIEKDPSVPQILIYHTHSQEAFADSVEGDVSTTIVGVGSHLKDLLEEKYGYNVIHHTAVYDMIDGELDRNRAYELAEADISQLLADNPTIEVVIDLHRDGVDGQKFVTEINGKPTARIMFFNGLSRTALNGPVDYLPNPYIEDNLAFSFQLQLLAAQYYPGYTRNIYLQSLRYNLHLRPRSLLIEAGTQLNTVEEEYNAMEPLADILNQVLQGTPEM